MVRKVKEVAHTTAKNRSSVTAALSRVAANMLQPTTIAGLLTIGATFATGGLASWLNPTTLPSLLAGVGLIFAQDVTNTQNSDGGDDGLV